MRRARWVSLAAALVLAAPTTFSIGIPAADQGAPAEEESELDRLLRLAREASPVVRPQAARRFVGMGAEAAARIREVTGGTSAGYATLGVDLLEVLGELGDDAVRDDLWEALDDRDFPWRPSVARTLANTAVADERDRFLGILEDAIAPVRTAGVRALGGLDDRRTAIAVRARLADENDRVRREAAMVVDRWGDPTALWWIVEDLKREDRFFEIDTGKAARFEAAKFLATRLGEDFGYAPEDSPGTESNREALARISTRVREVTGRAPIDLPEVARAGGAAIRGLLGLEVRSCRRGEFFLRWDADGFVWVGTGNASPYALAAGASEALLEAARKAAEELGEVDFWGEPGCDVEVLYLTTGSGEVRAYRVSKGPDAVEGLRPDALGALFARLLASLPEEASATRAAVREALGAVGGDLP